MTLREFIELFDKDDSIVLLEGKREVLENDKLKLTELGRLLTSTTAEKFNAPGKVIIAEAAFKYSTLTHYNNRDVNFFICLYHIGG